MYTNLGKWVPANSQEGRRELTVMQITKTNLHGARRPPEAFDGARSEAAVGAALADVDTRLEHHREDRMDRDELFAVGQKALAAQSFSRLLGTQLRSFAPGEAVLEIPLRADLLQQNGFVHGGVLSYAADNALTFAGGSMLGPNVLTSEYKINYLRPAQGVRLIARGSVVHSSRRQAVCRCDVLVVKGNGEERLCATAQGTIVAVSAENGAGQEPGR
jgi:uncharacterized protein (TIGR00369 family)